MQTMRAIDGRLMWPSGVEVITDPLALKLALLFPHLDERQRRIGPQWMPGRWSLSDKYRIPID